MKLPAGVHHTEAPLDNVQLIMQRRAELASSKAKYTLTETDAKLLSTHATEVQFEDGQTIVEEGNDITAIYRIRFGKVILSRHGFQYQVIGKGWLIGDAMLIYGTSAYTMKGTMKARGLVVLEQLNVPFIRNLFEIDPILKAKFMRHVTAKYSVFFTNIVNDLDHPSVRAMRGETSTNNIAELLTTTVNSPDLSSDSGSDTLSRSSSASSIFDESSHPEPASHASHQHIHQHIHKHHIHLHRQDRERSRNRQTYKTYPLLSKGHGVLTLQIRKERITTISKSFGFTFKTKMDFTKIRSISKVGDIAVTVIYDPRKVTSLFFKHYNDREEFFGIVNSLIAAPPQGAPLSPEFKRLQGKALTVLHDPAISYDVVPLCGGKEHLCKSQQTVLSLKKGDIVVEEGDLFQRVYTLLRGYCDIYQRGKQVCGMHEGDVFGVASLVYLRPSPVTLVVASETAELVYIPAHNLHAMLDTDIVQAADFYQRAAQALDNQISRAIGYYPHCPRVLSFSSGSDSSLSHSDSASSLSSDD